VGMMPTKVTVSGRPVFGNETPDTALMYSSSEHISAHYKRILAARDQGRAKDSGTFPDPAEARTADVFTIATHFENSASLRADILFPNYRLGTS